MTFKRSPSVKLHNVVGPFTGLHSAIHEHICSFTLLLHLRFIRIKKPIQYTHMFKLAIFTYSMT